MKKLTYKLYERSFVDRRPVDTVAHTALYAPGTLETAAGRAGLIDIHEPLHVFTYASEEHFTSLRGTRYMGLRKNTYQVDVATPELPGSRVIPTHSGWTRFHDDGNIKQVIADALRLLPRTETIELARANATAYITDSEKVINSLDSSHAFRLTGFTPHVAYGLGTISLRHPDYACLEIRYNKYRDVTGFSVQKMSPRELTSYMREFVRTRKRR